MCFLFLYIHDTNKLCYNEITEESSTCVGLISSYPIGGGGTMTKYEKISLIISILTLVVNIIALYN